MSRNRWVVFIGSVVLGLVVMTVSALIGGGWALVLLEVAAVGLVVVPFQRARSEDQDLAPGSPTVSGCRPGSWPRR